MPMPWKETSVMEQREKFIIAWQSGRYSKTDLCQRFNISRPTGDKWIKRHFEYGLSGLADRSKAPKRHPNATPIAICELLIKAKQQRPHWGPRKLLNRLRVEYPDLDFPANSTGDLILKRAGLVKPRRRKRKTPADSLPFSDCTSVNQCWSVDFKGDFVMGNKRRCYPLTITDNYSRYVLLCQAAHNTRRTTVFPYFERIFKEYGLPWCIRSDNGVPFASRALGGISKLSKWWIDLGIRPERIELGKPQQNGRHERMHRSLKDYLNRLEKIEYNLEKQQKQFDYFIKEFNEYRSHESLGDKTPMSVYQPSLRTYPNRIEAYDYGTGAILRKVKQSGEIKWQGKTFYLSQVLAGEAIALIPYADGIWEIYYRFHPLGKMNDREKIIQPETQWHKGECKPCARVSL